MVQININTEKTTKISPLLYGVFFEDINYGGDGGLYAELIANRSFEYYDMNNIINKHKMCWDTLSENAENFTFEIKSENHDKHKYYAELSGTGGIQNTGFGGEGFAVKCGGMFDFRLFARAGADTDLSIIISDNSGNIYSQSDIIISGNEWNEYKLKIETAGECSNAYLSLILPKGGAADLDFISLFPETFLGRKNGMRKDIAETIAALKPKFMRFPGGCIVEGRSFDNMYNWKDTIGPPEERPTNYNRWQMDEYKNLGYDSSDYFQSYGIGFYEYFQFCEDIGAKPVPVVNCGMTCQWHEALLIDLDELEPFVQDVFDLIEFANGDEKSEWGRKRIEMGHKEPFGLEYIGIGNEQWGEEYFERYYIFQKALSEKYPDIKLITSAGWKDKGWEFDLAYKHMSRNKDMAYAVDEHFYKEPEWFLKNINRYDNYDRTLPKVFIGEYAAHTSSDIAKRENNWYSALSEAAFLTGAERNADHVVMTCYAPLLARKNHQQWQPDLIWFDNDNVYLTPNYYVQKLFSQYLCEYAVGYECSDNLNISAGIKGGRLIVKIVNISSENKEVIINPDKKLGESVKITELKGNENNTAVQNTYITESLEKIIIAANSVTVMDFDII